MSAQTTPALDKRRAAIAPRPVNDVLSEFADWLTTEGIMLCCYGQRGERKVTCPRCHGKGFDPQSLTARERQLLRRGLLQDGDRAPCPRCPARSGHVWEEFVDESSLEPIRVSWTELFAAFLGLDLDAIEEEQRRILESL